MSYPTNPNDAVIRPTYLRNITQALYLDDNDQVTVRTGLSSNSIQFESESTDSFGRLRVSNPYTLFDTNTRYYDHQQFNSQIFGTAVVNYDSNSSTFLLNIGSANGDSIIRETNRVFPYQPGKSLLIFSTFCANNPKPNLRQRIGYFGSQNGVYFEIDGNTLNMVIRSSSSGSLVEERVPQSLWNVDKLDGSGGTDNPSGITLDPSVVQLWWCDIEWLGVGTVRVGFAIDGVLYTCHKFNHSNTIGNNTTYMTTATLPLRYEITNTGLTGESSSLRQICSTVMSEGGYNSFGITQTAGTGLNTFRCVSLGVYYPIVSIRLISSRLDSVVIPTQVDILSPTVNYYRWVLLLNPSLTGSTWALTSQTGTVQIDRAATSLTGGTEIQSGYASSRELTELISADYFRYQLGRTLTGTSDIVTLAIASVSNNADVLAQIGWQELT